MKPVRRPKVHRHTDGIPYAADRCREHVTRSGMLFTDRCKRARARGSAYCWQHKDRYYCWYDFENGHTCMLPDEHDGPHEPTPDSDILISLATSRVADDA